MKNKKGFTLIELLAIIVILAIIAVITVPIILNIIDNASKGASVDSANGYRDALQKYYATKSISNSEFELPTGYYEVSELPNDFTVSGELPSDGWVKLKKGVVERYSLRYKEYVVTMDSDKNVTSEKQNYTAPHVTNDYQEVEYLESTGTQYIDTQLTTQQGIGFDVTFLTNASISASGYGCILGGRKASGDNDFQITTYRSKSNYNGTIRNGEGYSGTEYNAMITLNEKQHISLINNTITYNDGTTQNANDYTWNQNSSIYLFGLNQDGSFTQSGPGSRIYNAKLLVGDNIVRNYVPVIRKSDSKPGMIDLANRTNNLFNPYTVVKGRQDDGIVGYQSGTSQLNVSDGTIYCTTTVAWRGFTSDYIEVSSRDYFISVPSQSGMSVSCSQYDINKQFIKKGALNSTLEENCKYIRFTFTFQTAGEYQVNNIMLNEGTQALSYEPYGYKFYTNAGGGEFIPGSEL